MADIKELFGGGSLSCEEFTEKLAAAGLVILEGSADDFVSASREAELQGELQSVRDELERKLDAHRVSYAVKLELAKRGAINPELAAGVIGCDGIGGSDEEIRLAAEDRVRLLMKSEPYMFKGAPEPSFSTGSTHTGAVLDTDSMSDSEYYSYRKML
ncbi:MAG: hypothetical protein IKM46_06815 [Clostridia bacterium]|nr:hypothetical protein [Clostridia bacterium]